MTALDSLIDQKHRNCLAAYRSEPNDIREHAGIEETVLAVGYGYRHVCAKYSSPIASSR